MNWNIFLNKLNDSSESDKIKNLINEYYYQVIKKANGDSESLCKTIDIFIQILHENENFNLGGNVFYESMKKLFTTVKYFYFKIY